MDYQTGMYVTHKGWGWTGIVTAVSANRVEVRFNGAEMTATARKSQIHVATDSELSRYGIER